jgi:hypothetical protein
MAINICATLGGNTGAPACDVRMGRPKYILLTTGREFAETDIEDSAAFQSALQTAMLLPKSNANKVYAFPQANESTDNTGDPSLGTLADGYEEVLNEALPKYLLRSKAGTCVQQQMQSFNGWPGKVYVVDDSNIMWFRTTSADGAAGFTCGYLYTNPPKFKGSGDVNTANTRLTFGSIDEFKTKVGAIKLDFNVSTLTNILEVELDDRESENTSGALNNVFVIGGKTRCEGTDIYAAYSTALNSVARWRAYQSNGTVISITTVTTNAGLSGWNITLNSAAFTALPSGTVFYIDLETPTVLHAAGIDGIEGNRIRFVKF